MVSSKATTRAAVDILAHRVRGFAAAAVYVLPALAVYGVFVLWPLARLAILSLERWDGFTPPVFVGLDNYAGLWNDPGFVQELRHSLLWLAVTLTVPVALGLALALLLRAVAPRPRAVLRALLLIPLLLPTVLIAVAWRLFYNPLSGPLTGALQDLHLGGLAQDWLGDPNLALPALLVIACWASFGLSMLICEAALVGISAEVVAAARVDGAGTLAILWAITLPALRGVVPLATVATAFCAVPSYDLITLITNGGPGYATTTLDLDAYGRAFGGMGQIGMGAALACLQGLAGIVLAVAALLIACGHERGEPASSDMPGRRRSRRTALATAVLIAATAAALAPLAWLAVLALRPAMGASAWATLGANLATVWGQGFGGAIATGLEMGVGVAAATAVLALPAAFAIAGSRKRAARAVAAALLALGLFQPLAVLIIPLFDLIRRLGLMDTAVGVIAPEVARVLPVAVLLLWIGVRGLPSGVLEAAAVDGAPPRQVLLAVALPLLRPLLVVILAWSFLVSWNDYLLPTVVIQDAGIVTVPTALAQFIGRFDTEYGLLATGALLALLPIVVLYAGLYRLLGRGISRLGGIA
ncbi:MAG TPA: ABC transporter permease subunit [Chloroflexota bacterium]|nr:ABC transporter permease subunit [Chloroflexota bacterium]